MNTHHANLPLSRQVQVELELSNPPARLLLLHADVEIEARSRSELDRVTLHFLNAVGPLRKLNRLLREMFDQPTIFLIGQICSHLTQQKPRGLQIQFAKCRFEGFLSIERESLQLMLDIQVGRSPERLSGLIWKTSVRRLRRFGAALNIRSAVFSSA